MTTLSLDSVFRRLRESDVYRSIVRHGAAETNRNRSLIIFENLFLHVHPVKVREKTLRFTYTYWLGGIALVCALILTATGVLLMFYYHPSVPQAYRDMRELEFVVDNGLFLRNMHRWAAHLMVFTAFLHMMRVFFHRAYRPPRQFNWVVGVVLLIVTLLLSYTGYLLPWDQLAFWGVSVGTNMAKEAPLIGEKVALPSAGRQHRVGECAAALLRPPLRRPAGRAAPDALGAHLARSQGRRRPGPAGGRLRRGGGPMSTLPPLDLVESMDPLATPRRVALVRPDRRPAVRTTDEKYVMTFPNLILREVILFQLVVIGLALAAIAFDAPLEGIANPARDAQSRQSPLVLPRASGAPPLLSAGRRGRPDAAARRDGARRHSLRTHQSHCRTLWEGSGQRLAHRFWPAPAPRSSVSSEPSSAGRSSFRRPPSLSRCLRPAEAKERALSPVAREGDSAGVDHDLVRRRRRHPHPHRHVLPRSRLVLRLALGPRDGIVERETACRCDACLR